MLTAIFRPRPCPENRQGIFLRSIPLPSSSSVCIGAHLWFNFDVFFFAIL